MGQVVVGPCVQKSELRQLGWVTWALRGMAALAALNLKTRTLRLKTRYENAARTITTTATAHHHHQIR